MPAAEMGTATPAIADRLASAVALHQAGDLRSAETIYQEILAAEPRNADALHLVGVIALHRRRFQEAADWLEQAIAVDPRQALYFSNLGTAYRSLGRLDEAMDAFRRAIHLDPNLAGAHYNLALAFEAVGELERAAVELNQTLALAPGVADAWNALARVTAAQKDSTAAIPLYRRAIHLRPAFPEARYNLGNALARTGRHEEAVAAFEQVLSSTSNSADLPRPTLARVYNNLGDSLKALDRQIDALAAFQKARQLDPSFAEAHNNLGAVIQRQGDLDAAEAAYRQALALDPRLDRARTNLGNIFVERGRLDEALACYAQALELAPGSPEIRFNRALLLLKRGDFAKGWPEYEHRFAQNTEQRNFREPAWDGSPLAGRTLLVWAEQGVGDQILFASCLPDLSSENGRVIVECEARLVPLFVRSFPWARIVSRPVRQSLADRIDPPVDIQLPLGSLPRLFRTDRNSFPIHREYLQPASDRVIAWRQRFAQGSRAIAIGFSWRGGKEPAIQRKRSTDVSHWRDLQEIADATFVDLQYGECEPEREAFRTSGLAIRRFDEVDPLRDFDEFAALVAACDLVVSVDNSTVHLAGALGLPVWTLLPFASDWRWTEDGPDSPWYPSMHLYRQPAPGDWTTVFARVAHDLRIWLEGEVPIANATPEMSAQPSMSSLALHRPASGDQRHAVTECRHVPLFARRAASSLYSTEAVTPIKS